MLGSTLLEEPFPWDTPWEALAPVFWSLFSINCSLENMVWLPSVTVVVLQLQWSFKSWIGLTEPEAGD